jgi:hypothetical protein
MFPPQLERNAFRASNGRFGCRCLENVEFPQLHESQSEFWRAVPLRDHANPFCRVIPNRPW